MDICKIWVSQKTLNRAGQIPVMMAELEKLPPIELIETEDGEIQVEDEHHRLMSIHLSGKTTLEDWQYNLTQKTQWRARIGKIDILKKDVKHATN